MSARTSDWPYSRPPYVNRDGAFPAPTADELAAYRSFLLAFAGGSPEGCDVAVPALGERRTVREVYPLRSARDADGDGPADPEGVVGWAEFLPPDLLAVAGDGAGSGFCLGVRGPVAGGVFYVAHDLHHLDPTDPRRVALVADSFEQFKKRWRRSRR